MRLWGLFGRRTLRLSKKSRFLSRPAVPTRVAAPGIPAPQHLGGPFRHIGGPPLGQQFVEPFGGRPGGLVLCGTAASCVLLRIVALHIEHRMNHGSVSPCSSSVPTTTTNVRNTSCGRPGNGSPDSVVDGTAKAAASDTTPRIPAHATMNT